MTKGFIGRLLESQPPVASSSGSTLEVIKELTAEAFGYSFSFQFSCCRATPYRRKSTPLILTRHLYHHTPLVEYTLKHLYMYPRTRVFGSWDSTQTYHRPYAHICMHMHTYGYTCVQMHPDARPLPHPRLTLHAYVCICIHMSTYACRCVHMHTH